MYFTRVDIICLDSQSSGAISSKTQVDGPSYSSTYFAHIQRRNDVEVRDFPTQGNTAIKQPIW